MKKAVIYARVSTDEQSNNFSIPSQIDAAKAYAHQHDMEVIAIYSEDASGLTYPRPQLEEALLLLEQRQAHALIVHAEDRLNRHDINGYLIRARLAKAKAELHFSLSGPCDLDNHLMLMIRDAIGADEVRRIRERVNRGMDHKVKSGAYPGKGPAPFGYRVAGQGREMRLEIDEEKARWVRAIYEWYLEGVGVSEIMRRLEAHGIERPGAGIRGPRLPRTRWQPVCVYGILHNEAYIGSYWYGQTRMVDGVRQSVPREDWVEVKVPPIIDELDFAKAQRMIEVGREKSKRNTKHNYLLAGMVRCECGYALTTSTGGHRHDIWYYRCISYRDRKTIRTCKLPHFRMVETNAAVWECIKGLLREPASLRLAVEEARAQATKDNQQLYDALHDIEEAIVKAKTRLQRAISLFIESDDADTRAIAMQRRSEIESVLAGLHREQDRYNQQILTIQISDESLIAVEGFSQRLSDKLDDLDLQQQRAVLQALGATVRAAVEDGQRVLYLHILLTTHRLPLDPPLLSNDNDCGGYTIATVPLTFRLVLAA